MWQKATRKNKLICKKKVYQLISFSMPTGISHAFKEKDACNLCIKVSVLYNCLSKQYENSNLRDIYVLLRVYAYP